MFKILSVVIMAITVALRADDNNDTCYPQVEPPTPPASQNQINNLLEQAILYDHLIEEHEEQAEYFETFGEEPVGPDPEDPNGYLSGNELAEIHEQAADLAEQLLNNVDQQLQALGYP